MPHTNDLSSIKHTIYLSESEFRWIVACISEAKYFDEYNLHYSGMEVIENVTALEAKLARGQPESDCSNELVFSSRELRRIDMCISWVLNIFDGFIISGDEVDLEFAISEEMYDTLDDKIHAALSLEPRYPGRFHDPIWALPRIRLAIEP